MISLCRHASAICSLVLSMALIGCGSSSSGGGAGGSLGKGGSGGGTGKDAASGSGGAGTGGAATGGAAGTVSAGGVGAGVGGVTVGTGGATAGTGGRGAGGSGGALDAGRDSTVAPIDAAVDSPLQPIDAGQTVDAPLGIDGGATLAQIKSLIAARCAGCHTGTGTAATRLNLADNVDGGSTLYARLVGPLLLETYCGENVDAGGDAAQARRAIVPGNLASSFLYLKITGTEPSPGSPPANCGVRMPRVFVAGVDGGAPTSVSCDSLDGGAAANCLGAADIDLVRQWILEGAPQ